uniref:SCP domain-containing protein n=1 Tax=Anopheles funestus TaxID=62324 RepID=A0A4Y0BF48_ANOFN
MTSWIFVTIVCCLVSGLQAQTNYCTTTYCSAGVPNVGCNPPAATGGPACVGKSPAVVVLDSTLQSLILSEHNTRRSQFALGQLGFLPASKMPTITWDAELAKQAGHNARSCVYGHDRCRNTPVYAWAGQNIAISKFYGMTKTNSQLLTEAINSWWSEYTGTSQGQLNAYPATSPSPVIGHFTQMASDQTDKMGCAMQYWLDGQWKTYYIVCNYAVTNVVGRATYKTGTVASGCTTGRNPTANMNGLCSTAEKIVPTYNK